MHALRTLTFGGSGWLPQVRENGFRGDLLTSCLPTNRQLVSGTRSQAILSLCCVSRIVSAVWPSMTFAASVRPSNWAGSASSRKRIAEASLTCAVIAAALSKVGFKGGSESNLQPTDFRSATQKSMVSTLGDSFLVCKGHGVTESRRSHPGHPDRTGFFRNGVRTAARSAFWLGSAFLRTSCLSAPAHRVSNFPEKTSIFFLPSVLATRPLLLQEFSR
jgi:hypothetical protein